MRFHSKYHAKNHHTLSSTDYPDSANDPIASHGSPFRGDFIMTDALSCATATFTEGLSSLTILDTIVNLSVGTLTLTSGFDTNTDGSNLINVDADSLDGTLASAFERIANKGAPDGYAPLDGSSQVPQSSLPDNINLTSINSIAIGDYLVTTDLSSTVAPLVPSTNIYGFELPLEFFPEELSATNIDVSSINNTSIDDFLRSQQLSTTVAPLVTSDNVYGYELPFEFIPREVRDQYVGFYDYNASNALSSVTLTSGAWTKIENDGAGANSLSSYRPLGMGAIWDVSANTFDWDDAGLNLGDMIDIRLDITVDVGTNNTSFTIDLVLAVGTPSEYRVKFLPSQNFPDTGTFIIKEYNGIYMGNNDTLSGGAYFEIRPNKAATMAVGGWYVKCHRRGF